MESALFALLATSSLFALKRRYDNNNSKRDASGQRVEDLVFVDPNSPRDADGHVHHLHVKKGEVANRILSVGDMGRAERIAQLLDDFIKIVAPRGFVTYTGTYKGRAVVDLRPEKAQRSVVSGTCETAGHSSHDVQTLVTILATGMGVPMMDFAVREARACVDGPMAMLRYGTCGGLRDTRPGSVVVATEGTVLVRREGDLIAQCLEAKERGITGGAGAMPEEVFPYSISKVVKPDSKLSTLFKRELEEEIAKLNDGAHDVVAGINASADSFYSSQGRLTHNFFDFNDKLIEKLESAPGLEELKCIEMETHHLFDLARCTAKDAKIYAAGAAMVMANRHTNEAMSKFTLGELEESGGRAGLETLIQFEL